MISRAHLRERGEVRLSKGVRLQGGEKVQDHHAQRGLIPCENKRDKGEQPPGGGGGI